MNYKVELSEHFKQEAKRLAKKYSSLKAKLQDLFETLENNPTIGTPLGKDVYKIRLAVASKNKGKSGGVRVISYVHINESTVLLLSIYNKGEKETISRKEIQNLLDEIL